MQSPPLRAVAADADTAEIAMTLAAESPAAAAPGEVDLNPLGEWTILAAWAVLLAVNLWTWRVLLKRRPAPPEAV